MRPVRRRRRLLSIFGSALIVAGLLPVMAAPVAADDTPQALPFSQAWTNTGLITVNDNWSGVPGITGFLGQNLTTINDVDPQTVLGESTTGGDIDVLANQTNTGITNGGVAEFEIANAVVALQGSGTADAPYVLFHLDTTGATNVTVAYNLRDIDGSADNAVQQVALQYRIGSTGNFTNLPGGYVADATTGPSLATQVTPISVVLPPNVNNQPLVQVRVITTNATGSDEWVGVDDISITAGDADAAPTVDSTVPANGATDVPGNSDITINFSEAVTAAPGWFTISCSSSGPHAATESGGPQSYTLDPDLDFAAGETCTVTVVASLVADVDADDPPDNMTANHVFSFTTTLPLLEIGQVQGAAHLSPYTGQLVKVEGVVVAERGSNTWIQDPSPDADPATSEGILVFGSAVANAVVVGDRVQVSGTVTEFRPGCPCAPTSSAFSNLTITEIASPGLGVTNLGPAPLPAATVIGARPNLVIEDDSTDNVETSGTFDPAQDGIDFYETLESMHVQVDAPVVVGPTNGFGEILVLADGGAGASLRTPRGGILVRDIDAVPVGDYQSGDFNPERIMLDDLFVAVPRVDVADRFSVATGVMTYDFANYKIAVTSILAEIDGGLVREVTRASRDQEIAVATYNVENLDPTDGSFARHAGLIVNNLRSPDVIAIEEIQDNDGAANTAVTDASVTWNMLIAAIVAAGGPTYQFRQINPVDDQDGGEPGGNIRVGFLFRTDREVSFIDRPGGNATAPTTVVAHPSGPQLSFSPGRIDPTNAAYANSRKPLVGEFRMHGRKVFVIALHLSSKGGDQPLFGRFQPPSRSSELARHAQAQSVNNFVDQILAADPNANVIVLGDVNDFEFSETVQILEGGVLTTLMDTLPAAERYSYVFEGNSQVLDQILMSNNLLGFGFDYDPVHVNAEFTDQASDHDPQVVRIEFRGRSESSG